MRQTFSGFTFDCSFGLLKMYWNYLCQMLAWECLGSPHMRWRKCLRRGKSGTHYSGCCPAIWPRISGTRWMDRNLVFKLNTITHQGRSSLIRSDLSIRYSPLILVVTIPGQSIPSEVLTVHTDLVLLHWKHSPY